MNRFAAPSRSHFGDRPLHAALISEGAHPRQVMEQLGHSSIAVTMDTYGKVYGDDMDSLADRLEQRHRAQNGTG